MSYRDKLRANHNRLRRGRYPYRPEVPPGRHGLNSDPEFWVKWFGARQHEEDREAAEIAAAPQRRSAHGY